MTSNKVSKVLGIKALETYFAIRTEEVLVIGDNFNDMDMIEYAGTGIAMGNAPQQVKGVSGFVTKSNNQEGMKLALETFVLS
ncbi:HAD family hydrolase [Priestia endophytica]|uniref:HAD family hydrolase n=1 Tax=Priestia endophytica TaxID=135735 RepID=UPI002413ACAF|nr:HAD hydrolase family protein [Priestia endophytica]